MNKSAQALGKMAAGKPKKYTPEEIKRRTQRLEHARESRRRTRKQYLLVPKRAPGCIPVKMLQKKLNITNPEAFLLWFNVIGTLDSFERDGFVKGETPETVDMLGRLGRPGVARVLEKAGCIEFVAGGVRLLSKTAMKGLSYGW